MNCCKVTQTYLLSGAALIIFMMSGISQASEVLPFKRYFYSGDGHIHLLSEKNGKRFSGRYRDLQGRYGDEAYRAIAAVFGAPDTASDRRLSLRLIEYLDYLEDRLGPGSLLTITSGYRPVSYNTNLRRRGALAAKASLHQYGMAADFVLQGVPSRRVWEYVQALGFGGTGYYHGKTVHVDVGPARFWDEKSSGVGTGLSDDNKLIGLVSDFDVYRPDETLKLTFIRMTAFPIGVNPEFTLIPAGRASKPADGLSFTVRTRGPAHDASCLEFTNIEQMAALSWRLPKGLSPGRYRILARFCGQVWHEMPKSITTSEFEIRSP